MQNIIRFPLKPDECVHDSKLYGLEKNRPGGGTSTPWRCSGCGLTGYVYKDESKVAQRMRDLYAKRKERV